MVLEDSKGNMFNVELILNIEPYDSGELLLLAKALYEKVLSLEEDNVLLKGVLSAKEDVKQGKVLSSSEFKEQLKLKKGG